MVIWLRSQQALEGGDLGAYGAVVTSFANRFDPLDRDSAALKLVHERSGAAPVDGVAVPAPGRRRAGSVSAASSDSGTTFTPLPTKSRERRAAARAGATPMPAPTVSVRSVARLLKPPVTSSGDLKRGRRTREIVRVRVGLGKEAGLRPADLVGAIAHETGVAARSLGDRHQGTLTVEVRASDTEAIVQKLAQTTIRGRRVRVERS